MNLARPGRLIPLFILSVPLALMLSGVTFEVYACSCFGPRLPCEAFGQASAVFIGRAVEGEKRYERRDENGKIEVTFGGRVHLAVEEVFSGIRGKEIDIDVGETNCGYPFEPGETYLVYADGDLKRGFSASVCSRTRRLADAQEDLEFLQHLPPKGTGARIFGIIYTDFRFTGEDNRPEYDGLAGIKVTARDAKGRIFTTVTGDDGRYEFNKLKPGTYKVEPHLPAFYELPRGREQDIADCGCAEMEFHIFFDGRVSGAVIDGSDRPLKNVSVALVSVDHAADQERWRSPLTEADEQGRFEISRIPPGRYRLGVNITVDPRTGTSYPPTWYPGVTQEAMATIINMGRGERLSGYTLKLAGKLTPHRMQGIVFWPDGRRAADINIWLESEEHPGDIVSGYQRTDANGRFELVGYEGRRYRVLAYAQANPGARYEDIKYIHAEPITVDLRGDVAGLRMILTMDQKSFEDRYQKNESNKGGRPHPDHK
jgi:hypothetical protein